MKYPEIDIDEARHRIALVMSEAPLPPFGQKGMMKFISEAPAFMLCAICESVEQDKLRDEIMKHGNRCINWFGIIQDYPLQSNQRAALRTHLNKLQWMSAGLWLTLKKDIEQNAIPFHLYLPNEIVLSKKTQRGVTANAAHLINGHPMQTEIDLFKLLTLQNSVQAMLSGFELVKTTTNPDPISIQIFEANLEKMRAAQIFDLRTIPANFLQMGEDRTIAVEFDSSKKKVFIIPNYFHWICFISLGMQHKEWRFFMLLILALYIDDTLNAIVRREMIRGLSVAKFTPIIPTPKFILNMLSAGESIWQGGRNHTFENPVFGERGWYPVLDSESI